MDKKTFDAVYELLERADKGLDKSATHDGLLNCDAIANARKMILTMDNILAYDPLNLLG